MRGVRAALLILVTGAFALGGAGSASAQSGNPLEGVQLYVDHDSPSWHQWQFFERQGQTRKANLIEKIAREPKAIWLGRFTSPNFRVKVQRVIDSASQQGQIPLFTVLRAQSTGCSPSYDGGGPAEDRRTRAWYQDLASVIGAQQVVIAFEPDSLGTIDCHAASRRDDRYKLLRFGVDQLAKLPNTTIYIEAGASDWEGATRMAKKLKRVGIAKVRGFMLNATHNDWTRNNIRYGLQLSRLVGGKHFVINTAENGRGGVHYPLPNHRRGTIWCNPGLRGLGKPPTTDTSNSRADAYLWINRPGYAQICQGRPIGWYLPRALSYARYATDWEAPPKGTRFGHYKRYPFKVFAGPRWPP
jgi:endoglucanase